MRNRKIKFKIVFFSIMVILFLILMSIKANAASFTASVSKTSVKVGDTVTVKVTANNAAGMYKVSSSNSSVLALSSGSASDFIDNSSATIVFKAKAAGNATITAKPSDMTDLDDSSKPVSGGGTYNISVKSEAKSNDKDESNSSNSNSNKSSSSSKKTEDNNYEKKVSNIATLSNLGITPKEYDFSTFKPGTESYTLKVPKEAENINIYAVATNSKATITGTGLKTLKEGTNTFYVKVTAEDKKTTKTYSLIINRAKEEEKQDEEEQEKENDDEKKNEDLVEGLTKLSVEGYNLTPEFNNEVYEYNLKLTEDVEKLNINTETSNEDIQVDILGNEQFKEGENVVTILVYNPKDESTTTYQIIADMDLSNINVENVNRIFDDAQENYKKQKFIIYGTMIAIVLLIIIFLIERYRIQRNEDFNKGDLKEETDNNIHLKNINQQYEDFSENELKNTKRNKGKRYK